jgi:UDP-N-acetylmuramoyl-L-alanyl-D-glutamate--2,6-diaminopimelate ligase
VDPRPTKRRLRIGDAPCFHEIRPGRGFSLPPEAADTLVTGVCLDSRRVQPGDVYAALPGGNTHGAKFAIAAASAGAAAVLTDDAGLADAARSGLPVIVHPDPRGVLGALSAWVYDTAARDLQIIGITGTNGKTTMSMMLESALGALGRTTGVIGTTGIHIGDQSLPSARTTPESPDVHALLAVMSERGVQTVAMEVSSHALALGRVDGVVFDAAVFTNLSQDHLDFHVDMSNYFATKSELFTPERAARAVICSDGDWGRRLSDTVSIPTTTYAINGSADWNLASAAAHSDGSWKAVAAGPGGMRADLGSSMVGSFNQANALGALVALVVLGYDATTSARGISKCSGVPGRMQLIAAQDFSAIVDYAHTPDAVERAIGAVREFCQGRITVVLGCGGDRDHEKRPLMGKVAAEGADRVIVTDDNPRSEDPAVIRHAVLTGARSVEEPGEIMEMGDRRTAIATAVRLVSPSDCLLVLGKGHETGQEIAGRTTPFDDRDEVAHAVSEREAQSP